MGQLSTSDCRGNGRRPTCCARRLCSAFLAFAVRCRPVIMSRMVRFRTPGTRPESARIAGRVRPPACTKPCGQRCPCLGWWIGRPDRAAARVRRESGGQLPGYPEPVSCWAHSFGGSGGPRASFGRRRNSFAGPMPCKGRDRSVRHGKGMSPKDSSSGAIRQHHQGDSNAPDPALPRSPRPRALA